MTHLIALFFFFNHFGTFDNGIANKETGVLIFNFSWKLSCKAEDNLGEPFREIDERLSV